MGGCEFGVISADDIIPIKIDDQHTMKVIAELEPPCGHSDDSFVQVEITGPSAAGLREKLFTELESSPGISEVEIQNYWITFTLTPFDRSHGGRGTELFRRLKSIFAKFGFRLKIIPKG